MTTDTIPQTVLFPDLFDTPLVATFDRQHASSDGGAVLRKAAERLYGLVAGFARCLVDRREPGKIRHTLAELLGQRIVGIACGHPDGNDANHLADDPIHKLLLGRDPVAGEALASQPTISRFENGVGRSALYELGRELPLRVIQRASAPAGPAGAADHDRPRSDRRREARRPAAHLLQRARRELVLPAVAGVSDLRPGTRTVSVRGGAAARQCAGHPRDRGRVVSAAASAAATPFPRRGCSSGSTGALPTPEIFDVLDAEPRLDYVVAMAKNAVLQRHAEPALLVAQAQSAASGQTAQVYADTPLSGPHVGPRPPRRDQGRGRSWLGDRAPRDNPRFVVTNLRQTPRFLYERNSCARGDIENRIKELLDGLQIDRTSCCRFWANQLRVLLTAAAYVLMQELRLRAARTACARAQVTWLRDRLLTLGAHVVGSVRRVVLHLPTATPDLHAWRHIALALGARAG